jgi:hypothetical protein
VDRLIVLLAYDLRHRRRAPGQYRYWKKNPARNPNSKDWGFIHWMDEQVQKKGRNRKNRSPQAELHAIGSVAMAGKKSEEESGRSRGCCGRG